MADHKDSPARPTGLALAGYAPPNAGTLVSWVSPRLYGEVAVVGELAAEFLPDLREAGLDITSLTGLEPSVAGGSEAFDTVVAVRLLGGAAEPSAALERLARRVRADGKILIIEQVGVTGTVEHMRGLYVLEVLDLLGTADLGLVEASIEGATLCARLQHGAETGAASQALAHRLLLQQEDLFERRDVLCQQGLQLAASRGRGLLELEGELEAVRTTLREVEERLGAGVQRIDQLEGEVSGLRAQLATARERVERFATTIDQQAERVAILHQQRDTWRERAEVRAWKLRRIRAQRWWRLRHALSEARRRPLQLLALPVTIARIVLSKPEAEPGPDRPAGKATSP